jgi:zinc transporter 5/7
MASTYALPASAMTHSHSHSHGHLHSHSHSHSPGRSYSTRALRQERSNGSFHSHSQSDLHIHHGHENCHAHAHHESHNHEREAAHLPTPPSSTGLPPFAAFEKETSELSPPLSAMGSYEPSLNDANVIPHNHGHHGEHLHPMTMSSEPRSRFTNLILPFVLRWPLLHTIMAEKDSRRIFYFMTYAIAYMCLVVLVLTIAV